MTASLGASRSWALCLRLSLTDFPATPVLLGCKPVYEKLPGWQCDIRGIRKYSDLPENCRRYVDFIEQTVGVPIHIVSNGPRRKEVLLR